MNEGNTGATQASKIIAPTPRTEYEGTMECKMRDLGAKIDEFSAKTCSAKEQTKQELEQKMQELKQKHEQASKYLKETKAASSEAWTEFKSGLDKAFDELKQAWEELRSGSEKAADKLHSH